MEPFLIKERYKVTQVLYSQENYAALQAVDIQSRENDTLLLNVYEGPYLKPYIDCFDRLRFCAEYRGMFLSGESLVTVFAFRRGVNIDQVFCKGAKLPWRYRLDTAQLLFHQGLAMADFPPEISCPALLSENIQIFPLEEKVGFHFADRPMEGLCQRELVFLLTDQIRKVLLKRWEAPRAERDFVDEVSAGTYTSAVTLYGRWTEVQPAIREAYEKIDAKTALGRALYLLFMNLSCWARNTFRGKKKGWVNP